MHIGRILIALATLGLAALFLVSSTPEIGFAALVLVGLAFMLRRIVAGSWPWHLARFAITAPTGIAAVLCLGFTGVPAVVLGASIGVLALGIASDLDAHTDAVSTKLRLVAAVVLALYLVALVLLRLYVGIGEFRGIAGATVATALLIVPFACAVALSLTPGQSVERTTAPKAG